MGSNWQPESHAPLQLSTNSAEAAREGHAHGDSPVEKIMSPHKEHFMEYQTPTDVEVMAAKRLCRIC